MATNPIPTRISPALWKFWEEFLSFESGAKFGGIYADKAGYHNYRANLPSSDYSVEEVAEDREGPSNYASAIDITLSDSDMVLYSKRLDAAMRRRDPRLFIDGEPVIREFIGTLDNERVYCYMLTGGIPQGVGSNSGVDWGRDKSHLWHIHISFIRKFCNTWRAMSGVLSIMKNESLQEWEFTLATQFNAEDKTELREAAETITTLTNWASGGGLQSKVGNGVLNAGFPLTAGAQRTPMWLNLQSIYAKQLALETKIDNLKTHLDTVTGDLAYIKSILDSFTADYAGGEPNALYETIVDAIEATHP